MKAYIEEELVYAAVSSNRNENNISCQDKYLLYSKCRSPIIYNLESKLVVAILIGHTAEVNGQCFVESEEEEEDTNKSNDSTFFVISTAHDKSMILWKIRSDATLSFISGRQYDKIYQIESPDGSVFMTRSSVRIRTGIFITVLTSMEGNIYLYENDKLMQTIATKDCYFDSKFYSTIYKPQNGDRQRAFTCFALAGSDNKVHLYKLTSNNKLESLLDLSGFNDWIKCLSIYTFHDRYNEFLLAAACQDSLIQVWHLRLTPRSINDAIRVRTKVSKPIWDDNSDIKLTATLETVLSGHVGFVHGLCWFKNVTKKDKLFRLQLISCSSDRTVIIWRSAVSKFKSEYCSPMVNPYEYYPASEGVWQQLRRIGETGEVNLPFLGVCLSKDESTLYAQSLRGAIHSWSLNKNSEQPDWWIASETITGHYDSVTDLAWERTGAYLLSSSNDKTCRLHAIAASDNKWHELARPQVHGYEINCICSLNFTKFASGAEEKTIRTYELTKFFLKNFKALAKRPVPDYCREELETILYEELPSHAQLPALGLSNRGSQYPFDVNEEDKTATVGSKINNAVSSAQQQLQPQSGDSTAAASKLSDNNSWQEVSDLIYQLSTIDHLNSLPHEEVLLLSTLWWEKNKLFGHCNELHAIASDSTGSFLASASKANRADLASVIVWDTEKFRKVASIEHHTLTITRIRFSPDDKYLLSVSRDRTWCLCERDPNGQLRNAYRRLVGTVKTNAVHERIIWDCCWTYDSKYFLTVSRDKKAILWSVDDLRAQLADEKSPSPPSAEGAPTMNLKYVTTRNFRCSIQAVASTRLIKYPHSIIEGPLDYVIALGFEDGSLELYNLVNSGARLGWKWHLIGFNMDIHQLSVRRLAFQPLQSDDGDENSTTDPRRAANQEGRPLLLASGGDDCMVRLTRFHLMRNYPDYDWPESARERVRDWLHSNRSA